MRNKAVLSLKDIADRAADPSAERFVLDDGWFGARDDDTTSLGDWQIDTRKYPDELGPLIDHIHSRYMTFGLWFEPEMINPNSELHRAHPDWALGPQDQTLGRQKMLPNMALPEVRDYIYECIAAIRREYPIDYIKWDHNRVLPAPDAAQTRGTYALERMAIQHNAALFLPMVVTGSHVGPRHCHTSGRTLDISSRAWVAAQRHMGLEMDPRALTLHEATVLKEVSQWWKANHAWRAPRTFRVARLF